MAFKIHFDSEDCLFSRLRGQDLFYFNLEHFRCDLDKWITPTLIEEINDIVLPDFPYTDTVESRAILKEKEIRNWYTITKLHFEDALVNN